MKKILLFILLLVSLSATAQQRQISYIDNDGRWYHVYDHILDKIENFVWI